MPLARSSTVGVTAGVVVLAGLVGFGVGLPKVIDSPGTATEMPALPDEVAGLQAVATVDVAETDLDEDVRERYAELLAAAADSDVAAAENLAAQYGDAEVRMYLEVDALSGVSAGGSISQLTVTVVPGEQGLLMPGGPYEADTYTLEEVDGNRCSVITQNGYSATGEASLSHQVECRTSADGLTYDVYSVGMSPEEASAALDEVVDASA
ncbi:hypothetical protein [Nocardioides sp. YIM 152588]|uniref:hypothetical protein n=1 Tax=Nocardioides sp. YIM 152588 TaxID=3158259 RepID=UPI0032E3D84D